MFDRSEAINTKQERRSLSLLRFLFLILALVAVTIVAYGVREVRYNVLCPSSTSTTSSFADLLLPSPTATPLTQLRQSLTCPRLRKASINVDHTRKRVRYSPVHSDRWGNVLSPYWQARAVAHLANYTYHGGAFAPDTWMRHLPTNVTPAPNCQPDAEGFGRMCRDAGPKCDAMVYAHKCVGGWNLIVPAIQAGTRHALERDQAEGGVQLREWLQSDVVVYDRCAEDTVCGHPEHAPLGFSALAVLLDRDNITGGVGVGKLKRVVYVYDPQVPQQLCVDIRAARIERIKQLLPEAEIELSAGTRAEDFAKLALAPNVFVTSQGSSFALWSTLANTGRVWMPRLYGEMAPDDVGANYRWLTKELLLTTQVCRDQLNVTNAHLPRSSPLIVQWLQTH
jgi:hypothetical protein